MKPKLKQKIRFLLTAFILFVFPYLIVNIIFDMAGENMPDFFFRA
jgi:hypothetical protein